MIDKYFNAKYIIKYIILDHYLWFNLKLYQYFIFLRFIMVSLSIFIGLVFHFGLHFRVKLIISCVFRFEGLLIHYFHCNSSLSWSFTFHLKGHQLMLDALIRLIHFLFVFSALLHDFALAIVSISSIFIWHLAYR